MIEWLACLTHNLKFVSSNPSLTIMFCLRPREGEGLGGGGGVSAPPPLFENKVTEKKCFNPNPYYESLFSPHIQSISVIPVSSANVLFKVKIFKYFYLKILNFFQLTLSAVYWCSVMG